MHDAIVECFTEIQKIEDNIRYLEKHLEIASQINEKMEFLHTKIGEMERWRDMEKNVPTGLPTIKAYDIILHTFLTMCVKRWLPGLKKALSKVLQE